MSTAGADEDAIDDAAIEWVVRRDRGLSPGELVELQAWLAADTRHQAAFERSCFAWGKLQPPADVPWEQAPRWKPVLRRWLPGVAAGLAAAALIMAVRWRPPVPLDPLPDRLTPAAVSVTQMHALADGSTAQLNRGASISEAFTEGERHIVLHRGEAFFEVAEDASRPFVVTAGTVRVSALGTAFSTHWSNETVDVVVTEGVVSVEAVSADAHDRAHSALTRIVSATHRATISRSQDGEPSVIVSPVTPGEISSILAWREPLLTFDGAPLSRAVKRFQQSSGHRISITDPATAALQIGGSFPANDLDGFLQLLDEYYGVAALPQADGSLRLELRQTTVSPAP